MKDEALSIAADRGGGTARPIHGSAAASGDTEARFTRGSILRHTLVMTATGTVGTLSIFAVDLLSLVYVSRLGRTELKAAVGFATQVLVYPIAINIGLTIAITAAVSRALGARHLPRARHIAATGLAASALISAVVALLAFEGSEPLLALFGAKGETRDIAHRYLEITLPGNVPFALGMALSGILRAVGDAKRAMFVTLGGGLVVAMLDPLLIFGFGLGIDGAAISTLVSRFVFLAIGLHGVWRVHGLIAVPRLRAMGLDLRILATVALPAILTNLATPFANGFALHVYAGYGNAAVAASAVIDRTVYVAFAAIFALTGAVGPILGQNLGAGRFDRVRETLTRCFLVTTLYALAIWLVLALGWPEIVGVVPAFGRRRRLRRVLLHGRRLGLAVHQPVVRRQRGVQQPGVFGPVDGLQLGSCDARHLALRQPGRVVGRREGRPTRRGGGRRDLRRVRGGRGLSCRRPARGDAAPGAARLTRPHR